MKTLHVVSVSGGKDSTALYLWAIDQFGKDGFSAIFCDTDNEHPVTPNYVKNLHLMSFGPEVIILKSDFKERLRKKGLGSSGNAFLDMMLWKGRAPSSKAQFCTEFMKLKPTRIWLESMRGDREVIMYTGIRTGESPRRAKMPDREWSDYFDCETVRPLFHWTEKQVFDFLNSRNMALNPLYAGGFKRVGCYPCIHNNKTQLARLENWAWDKLELWEAALGRSWFPAGMIPGKYIPTIAQARFWCKTKWGGKVLDPEIENPSDVPSCMSTWGICE